MGAVNLFVRMGWNMACMQTQYQFTEVFNPPHEQNKLRQKIRGEIRVNNFIVLLICNGGSKEIWHH